MNLSFRERQVFWCLIAGMSYQQIADLLGLSRRWTTTLVMSVYRKHNVKDRLNLLLEYLRA